MEWAGHKDFNEQEWRTWTVNGHDVGVTKSAGPLTFATIWAAGHMISVNPSMHNFDADFLSDFTSLMISQQNHLRW